MSAELVASNQSFGGVQQRYKHLSSVLKCEMHFSVYLPPEEMLDASCHQAPVIYWLSGLTCTDENFVQKAGAQRSAAQQGVILIAPDTSPRGDDVADDPEGAYDLGLGAGFYLNATQAPWSNHYRMYDYIVDELPALVNDLLPVDAQRQAIMGHSMGGHGALTIGLKNPQRYQSVSAFAPICAPSQCPWGEKALSAYLGDDRDAWLEYDAVALLKASSERVPLLVDQGGADQFLAEQLKPELLLQAASDLSYPLQYHLRDGYDHSYFYIASFIDEHIRFHASYLK